MRPRRPFAAAPEIARRTATIGLALLCRDSLRSRGRSVAADAAAQHPPTGPARALPVETAARAGPTASIGPRRTGAGALPVSCPISDPSLRGVFRLPGGSSGGSISTESPTSSGAASVGGPSSRSRARERTGSAGRGSRATSSSSISKSATARSSDTTAGSSPPKAIFPGSTSISTCTGGGVSIRRSACARSRWPS